MEEAVVEAVEQDPRRSMRVILQMCLHPYHYTRVQYLREEDYPRRE
jgi:hypothetical protein